MRPSLIASVLLAFSAGLLPYSTNQAMAPKPPAGQRPSLAQPYTWHDGDRQQTAWLNPYLVAEFNAPTEQASAVRQLHPGAMVHSGAAGATRIWRVAGGSDITLSKLRSVGPTGKFSPVFHDAPGESGRLRALPGNIIVYCKQDWSDAQVADWAKSRDLELVNKLNIGKNVWVIRTEPGLAALETANRLHDSGEVVSASPNWWQEVSKR